MEMQKVTAEYEALSAREAELAAALEEQRRLHANLAASLLVANDLATNHVRLGFRAYRGGLNPILKLLQKTGHRWMGVRHVC